MNKLIPFFILSFLTVATGVSFSQVPVMRGLPLSPETKSLFNRGTPSDEPGNKSVWGGERKNTSSWGHKPTLKSRPGAEPKDEMALKKRARSSGVEDPCPPSVRLARKKARMDAGNIRQEDPMGHMGPFHAQVQAAIRNLFTVYKAGVFGSGEGYSCSEAEGYVQPLKPAPIENVQTFCT